MIGKEAWWKSWKVGDPCHNKEIKLISGYGREVTQGFFSVSSAYEQLYDIFKGPQVQGNLSQVWRMKIPLKVNFFVWRAFLRRLPMRQNPLLRNIQLGASNVFCPLCNSESESVNHILFRAQRFYKYGRFVTLGLI